MFLTCYISININMEKVYNFRPSCQCNHHSFTCWLKYISVMVIVKLLYYKIGFRKHKSILRIEHLEVGNHD